MPLALAARQRQPALADARVVAVRQLGDEAGGLRALGRPLDLLARRVRPPVGDVLVHRGARTGTGRRRRRAIAPRSEREVDLAHVGAVDQHRALGRRRTAAASSCTSVVLPEPVAPTSATVVPASTSRSMSRSAGARAPS